MSNPLRTHVKNFLLYKFWEIGPSFINKYTVSVSIYERLAGVTSKLAQNEYTGPATFSRISWFSLSWGYRRGFYKASPHPPETAPISMPRVPRAPIWKFRPSRPILSWKILKNAHIWGCAPIVVTKSLLEGPLADFLQPL